MGHKCVIVLLAKIFFSANSQNRTSCLQQPCTRLALSIRVQNEMKANQNADTINSHLLKIIARDQSIAKL